MATKQQMAEKDQLLADALAAILKLKAQVADLEAQLEKATAASKDGVKKSRPAGALSRALSRPSHPYRDPRSPV